MFSGKYLAAIKQNTADSFIQNKTVRHHFANDTLAKKNSCTKKQRLLSGSHSI